MAACVKGDAVPAVVEVFAVYVEGVDIVEGNFLSDAEMEADAGRNQGRFFAPP